MGLLARGDFRHGSARVLSDRGWGLALDAGEGVVFLSTQDFLHRRMRSPSPKNSVPPKVGASADLGRGRASIAADAPSNL